MSKRQLIDAIRAFNVTVQASFLAQFDEAALKQYLSHLESAQRQQVRITSWSRPRPKWRMAC
jgi:Mg/Co/Ni transporter MgtE